jgi:putative transposase
VIFCGWKEGKAVAQVLQNIYRAESATMGRQRLEEFEQSSLGQKYPMIGESWKRNWEEVIPFFSYPPEIRKMIYTTNAIESLNMQLRKAIKSRGHFPIDDAAMKLIDMVLRNTTKKRKKPPVTWNEATRYEPRRSVTK